MKPAGAKLMDWIAAGRSSSEQDGVAAKTLRHSSAASARSSRPARRIPVRALAAALDRVTNLVNILMGGVFHASILFLVAAGLQVVFGVQKVFNLACGSFYALGAYFGVSAVQWYIGAGGPPAFFIVPLVAGGSPRRRHRHRRWSAGC